MDLKKTAKDTQVAYNPSCPSVLPFLSQIVIVISFKWVISIALQDWIANKMDISIIEVPYFRVDSK